MNTTLTFGPEDDYERHLALRGGDYLAAINDFDHLLRDREKYQDCEHAEFIRKFWYEILRENRIDLTENLP